MSLIELEDVWFTYRRQADDVPVLKGISCSIEDGEFVGITGPSDAGKTTLCRLIPSYIPNFFDGELEGSVRVAGNSIEEVTIGDMAGDVGMVFENPFDQLTGGSMTVFEEVAFGLENLGLPQAEIVERTREALDTVGIGDLLERNPQQLSGGQSQRLALASILAMEPEILVLDEPASQLDPRGTEEVFDVIADMADREFTIVIASQDMERLGPHLDQLLVVNEGRMQSDGRPADVLTSSSLADNGVEPPDVVRIGKRLREAGLVDDSEEVPLRTDEVVEELRPHVTTEAGDGQGASVTDGNGRAGSETLVDVDDLHHYYTDEIRALEGISLEMGGGCICLIGQNGAGKTTLAKHLNGLLKPTKGRVTVVGLDTRDHYVSELAHHVGFSFQNPDDQLFHSTVAAEVRFGPGNLDLDEETADNLTEEAMEWMDLGDVAEENPYNLGQARRKHIAIASVLAMDTEVVVLDEPTGGQDAYGIELLGDVVERLVAAGKLVLVITHDVGFARAYGDRIIALGPDGVLLDGAPREVFARAGVLAETHVEPPKVTQIGDRLGLPRTVLTVEELFEFVEPPAA